MYILTFDYELFGSGKGDVFKHLVDPTKSILVILNELNLKATFFVEQLEIDAIIELQEHFPPASKEHIEALAVEQQLHDIIQQGHDIQLHLHPQWYKAKYENKEWHLNFDWWRFSALPYNTSEDGTPGKYELIKTGKESLEKRVRKTLPTYQCHSFRAGGYNVGDGKSSVDALVNNGLKLDSSVCPGFFSNSKLSKYDYTAVNANLYYWRSKASLLSPDPNATSESCLQLPLVTVNSSFREKLSCARIYTSIKNRKFKSVNYSGTVVVATPDNTFSTNTNFDVCLSSRAQIKKLYQRIEYLSEYNSDCCLITLIGHPKDYSKFSPMKRILKKLSKEQRFITVADFVQEVNK